MLLDKGAQSAKLSVLQKIIDMMDDETAKGLKKPDASVLAITAKDPDGDGDDDSGEGDDQASALEKALGGAGSQKPEGDEDDGDDELLQKLIQERMGLK